MKKELEEFLKSINNGKITGSQKKLSNMLHISKATISRWIQGTQKPSDDSLYTMATLFKKNIEELKKIFNINEPIKDYQILQDKLSLKDKEIELANRKIEFLEEQVEYYKSKLETKKCKQ